MVIEDSVSNILRELSAIAKAPMTPAQREERTRPLAGDDGSVANLARATLRPDLPWNAEMALAHGTAVDVWIEAVKAVSLPDSRSLAQLLDRLHSAEAAVGILKSGYKASRDESGAVRWTR